MCDLKPKFPKLEARIAELGFNNSTLGERLKMGSQGLGRRLRCDVMFDVFDAVELMRELDATFNELFGDVNWGDVNVKYNDSRNSSV